MASGTRPNQVEFMLEAAPGQVKINLLYSILCEARSKHESCPAAVLPVTLVCDANRNGPVPRNRPSIR